jgi:hypothetical protein
LRAVAVVHVPIRDEHAPDSVPALRVAGRDGHVVDNAKTHAAIGCGVMAGRPYCAESVSCAPFDYGVHCIQDAARCL